MSNPPAFPLHCHYRLPELVIERLPLPALGDALIAALLLDSALRPVWDIISERPDLWDRLYAWHVAAQRVALAELVNDHQAAVSAAALCPPEQLAALATEITAAGVAVGPGDLDVLGRTAINVLDRYQFWWSNALFKGVGTILCLVVGPPLWVLNGAGKAKGKKFKLPAVPQTIPMALLKQQMPVILAEDKVGLQWWEQLRHCPPSIIASLYHWRAIRELAREPQALAEVLSQATSLAGQERTQQDIAQLREQAAAITAHCPTERLRALLAPVAECLPELPADNAQLFAQLAPLLSALYALVNMDQHRQRRQRVALVVIGVLLTLRVVWLSVVG